MIESDMQVVLAMLLYFVVVVVIGFVYAKRSNSSSEEYFLGGRGLGPWLTALSAEASDMSGWLLMGLPGVAYFTGASDAMWTAIGLAIGTYLNWKFVAKRLRKYSEKAGNAITVPYVDVGLLETYLDQMGGTILGLYNVMSGGAFAQATVFALSIQPYINASIIIQLLTVAIPALERLAKDGGEEGRKKIQSITR